MKWRRLERSSNVDDRRGRAPAVAGGVGGLGIIGVLLALFLGGGEGGDLNDILGQLGQAQTATTSVQTLPSDEDAEFVSAVLGTTETMWSEIFASSSLVYEPASLVLFTDATSSGCGGANAQVGPHYCSLDRTIYIDLGFFDELESRFGASGGDFAEAYVIAHEVAHHVQNLLGVTGQVQSLSQQDPTQRNDLSIRLELQADCFAGVWANSLFQRDNVLEAGDIEEGLDAARAVGDDRIQESVTGRIDRESWTHGSSAQRVDWLTTGYETGDANACDTFSGTP